MTSDRLVELIARGEQIDLEFKSDRQTLSDRVLYEEVVALANASGGILLIGVEDDGTVTGAHVRHGDKTDPRRIESAIFNNTIPSISTRVSVTLHSGKEVISIEVDRGTGIYATMSGKVVRRTIKADGKPQSTPFYPHDQISRRIDLGLQDFSAQTVDTASLSSFDPLETERLRQTIARLHGDHGLLELSDEELIKALRLVESNDRRLIPNVAGLLLLGHEEEIRSLVPTHAAYFQVLDSRGDVKVNDVFYSPLIRTLGDIEARFTARVEEQEIMVGLFRVPVPDYSLFGFREAVNNALLHRDYAQMGAVYIQWQDDRMFIASPGGFPYGVAVGNILVHEPKPRNTRLAEAFRRIGIIEQTGRGVDRIYMGQIRYGRPAPDYSQSDSTGVRIVLHGGQASLKFTAMIYEIEKNEGLLRVEELLVLNVLAQDRRIDSARAGNLIQQGVDEGRALLERLMERGLIEARGEKKWRVYHLSARCYSLLGQPERYVRSRGIDELRQQGLIMEYIVAQGKITSREVEQLLGLTRHQVRRVLDKMRSTGKITRQGPARKGSYYVAGHRE